MNVLFVNTTTSWGGIKTWMLELAGFLQRQGHQVAFVCRPRDLLVVECEKRGFTCHPVPFGMDFSLLTIRRLWRIFTLEQTDLVVTNIAKGVRTAGVAASLKGLAHINRLGNYGDLRNSLKARVLYTLLVDRLFVPSQSLFDHFASYGFLRKKLRMFHNAVTPPALQISPHSPLKFAIVAKLSKRKQVDKVLLTLSRIQDLPWELHIGGFGPELRALKQLASNLNLTNRVYFSDANAPETGGKVDPYEFLSDKDVGILYSTQEGFPYSLVEYMAMSCAVIASDIEGIRELISHRENGLLVDPLTIANLEHALREVLVNTDLRERLIRTGYALVVSQFSQEHIFSRVEQEMLETIAEKQTL